MKNLTLVIPAKNESKSLPIVLESLKKINCKILVSLKEDDIDTIESIKNYNIEIHKQSKKGYGNSLIEGINNDKSKQVNSFKSYLSILALDNIILDQEKRKNIVFGI